MTTIASYEHEFAFDDDFCRLLNVASVSADDVADYIEHNTIGADLVTGLSTDGATYRGLSIEQYALLLPESELRANVAASLTKFRDWLFKFSPELASL